jgi:hypothetical protein
MSNQLELNSYIAHLRQRLRLDAWLRGAAIFTGTALIVTIVLVMVLNHLAFPDRGLLVARLSIFIALGVAATIGIALPLIRLTHARAVHTAESATPELEQRLTTFQERENKGSDPFLELLAADTLSRLQNSTPAHLVPEMRLFVFSGAGFACLAVLVWLIAAGPGYLGYGSSLLWTGPKKNASPLYSIAVTPGNVTVRRNSDQLVQARVNGMQPAGAKLYAHFQSAAGWEPVQMQAAPQNDGSANYQFVLAGLPENVEYYVSAGPLVSPHYKVHVVDLPQVKEIAVTYNYPKWTGLKPVAEEHTGDLRALEGTDAKIEIQMDRPLKDGQLTLDNGRTIQLAGVGGNKYEASIHMENDGAYHVAGIEDGQPVRISEDYFIATDKANPPEISIIRPGGDYRASSIEEVTLGAKAADEFGLADVHLHYSFNGGADHDVSLLKTPGAKNTDGTITLNLEDYKLVPGDLVSVYATARDGHSEARTDINFIQVDPFEREFSQSQQSGGGGGGGGNNQSDISKREKELIAATWKQQNDKTATPKDSAAQGQFLSDAQRKLRDQVTALSLRMQSRDISSANQEFTDFDKDMQIAASAMAPSADKLKETQWKDALPLEQKALQALLRAEATFRKIEVAFGQRGGGGGGSGSTGRDLASLFDLELDTEKNQYETAQTSSPAEQHEKEIEDALAKLDALARRQEDLANQQHNPQQSFQERWQQEMLRREAEQLQRQMEQLSRNGQGQQGGQQGQQSSSQQSDSNQQNSQQSASQSQSNSRASGQQKSGQSSASSSGSSAGGGSDSTDQRVQQALNRLGDATEAMKRNGSAQQNAEAAQQAAERLREASNLMSGTQQHLANNKVESLARDASGIQQEERAQAGRIDKLSSRGGESSSTDTNTPDLDNMMSKVHERDQLAAERQRLSDDLSRLQKNMRDAARTMAPSQPSVAKKLRDALTEMDDADLGNHVQRTADWLRSGINPNSMGTENQIAQGLSKLNQQLQQAQKEFGQGRPGQESQGNGDQTAALNQVERLRRAIEGMGRPQDRGKGRQGQNGNDQIGNSARQPGSANSSGSQGSQSGADGQMASQQNGGAPGGQQSNNNRGQYGGNRTSGDLGNQQRGGASGNIRTGGRGADGTVWDNLNTGNNTYGSPGRSRPAPSDASGNPADSEREFAQRMGELNKLRQMVADDPQAAKEVAELTRQMQNLDPKRFPGNPAMVEQMHHEVLSSVDKLELQLQQQNLSSSARAGKPDTVPAGYQDSVNEYYRRLSSDHK